ncbi:MAG: O-antigen polymerase [Bryobacterales bacterium]|nr:O-antigen polymerase [Bryobacterales bacterium]
MTLAAPAHKETRDFALAPVGAIALTSVLIAAVLVAWAPGFWATSLLHIGVFLIAIVWLASAVRDASRWTSTWLYVPLALAAAWGPLQIALHATVYPFETAASSLNWLTDFIVFVLAAQFLRARSVRDRFLNTLLYFGFAVIVIAIVQSFTSPKWVFWVFESRYQVIGPFVYKNQFAAFVELLLPIALYRMLAQKRRAFLYGFLGATMFAAVVMSASRVGTILLAIEILFVMIASWGRRLVTARVALLLFLQMFVLLAACTAVVGWEALGEHFQDQTSGAIRRNLLLSSIQMIRDRPWVGWGLGNWKAVYPVYALFDNAQFANAAHCDWAQWTAEGGIFFTLLLAAVFIRSLVLSWRWLWGAGVFFVLVHSFFDYPTREPVIGAILFALLGAMSAARNESRTGSSAIKRD